MLDKQMAEIECPGSKKRVKLDTIHLSIGADGFNATKATVTSVTAVAIGVLNLPIDVQSRLEFLIIPVVLPISVGKQDDPSFFRPVFDTLYNLEQKGIHIETDDMIIQADVQLDSIT
ncbi:hypothetical protein IW139_003276, partial [Coemansia sp. RSA 353]